MLRNNKIKPTVQNKVSIISAANGIYGCCKNAQNDCVSGFFRLRNGGETKDFGKNMFPLPFFSHGLRIEPDLVRNFENYLFLLIKSSDYVLTY